MKKIICILFLSLVLFGCQSSAYERSSEAGTIQQIGLKEMEEKIQKKESFAIMLTQSMCGYCHDFKENLVEYQKTHHVVMYEVVLDKEPTTKAENLEIIYKYFDEFSTTPGIFYVKEGKKASYLKAGNSGITKDLFEKWVVDNEIDKK